MHWSRSSASLEPASRRSIRYALSCATRQSLKCSAFPGRSLGTSHSETSDFRQLCGGGGLLRGAAGAAAGGGRFSIGAGCAAGGGRLIPDVEALAGGRGAAAGD